MDKQQIISFIKEQIAAGKISPADLNDLGQAPETSPSTSTNAVSPKETSNSNLINIFYAIGGIIAVIGVAILIAQNWREIGFFGRISVTLGLAVITYIVGLFARGPEHRVLSQLMFTLSVALAPLGIMVLLNEADVRYTINLQIMISLSLAVIYGVALWISKRNILVIFTVGFLTWTYYTLIFKIFESLFQYDSNILKWATMLLGFSYLLISFGLKKLSQKYQDAEKREKEIVSNFFSAIGTIAILGAGISIGGFFDLVFIVFIFAGFYGSVYLRNSAILWLSALFLVIHIIKLTSKYFIDSIGWPVALIASGFVVIGIGYLTYYLNKKYIR